MIKLDGVDSELITPQNKSTLNEKQAERMLNALRQEEKRLQQNKQNKKPSGTLQEKDW